jgi:hypothetical protein
VFTSERLVAKLVAEGRFLTSRKARAPWVVYDGFLYRLHDVDAVSGYGPFKEFVKGHQKRGLPYPWNR